MALSVLESGPRPPLTLFSRAATKPIQAGTRADSRGRDVVAGLPPGFITLNPNHGPGAGCFWGTKEDLDRVITAEGPNFEKLVRGVFQARLSTNVALDHATGLFSGEEQLETLLKNSGITDGNLYLVYLAHGLDDNVLLINTGPPPRPSPRTPRSGRVFSIPSSR